MSDSAKSASTFERSCDHWSGRGQVEMEAFYRLAAVDYKLLAEQLPWGTLFSKAQNRFSSPLRLLDVACGSGQFPNALLEYGELDDCPTLRVEYSLLDPSQFSIDVARQKLRGPFEAADELLTTAQDLNTPADLYSIMWATHALYCVPPDELELALDRMLDAMDPTGLGFIAHASQDSHYLKFHDLYLQTDRGVGSLPYCRGEQITEILKRKFEPSNLVYWAIDYEGTVALDDNETAQRYLQRCLFDDTFSLQEMLANELLGPYLNSCMDDNNGLWRFKQKTWLVFYGDMTTQVQDLRRK